MKAATTKSEWLKRPQSKTIASEVVEAIARRRRQMLIHCFLYYSMDRPVISDDTWQKWATQLWKLQKKFGWQIGFYDSLFCDWDGSTGYHLQRINDTNVMRVALRTMHYCAEEERERERILS